MKNRIWVGKGKGIVIRLDERENVRVSTSEHKIEWEKKKGQDKKIKEQQLEWQNRGTDNRLKESANINREQGQKDKV